MPRFEQAIISIDEIPAEDSAVVEFFGRKVHVVRDGGNRPAAYMDACMHLGGPLACENGEFVCQWHGARFDARSGRRINGPAADGAKLMRLPTVVKDGVLTYVWGSDEPEDE